MAFTGGWAWVDEEGDTENIFAAYDESYIEDGIEKGAVACYVYNPESYNVDIQWAWYYESTTFGNYGDGDQLVYTTDFYIELELAAAYYQYGTTWVSLWGNVTIEGYAVAEID